MCARTKLSFDYELSVEAPQVCIDVQLYRSTLYSVIISALFILEFYHTDLPRSSFTDIVEQVKGEPTARTNPESGVKGEETQPLAFTRISKEGFCCLLFLCIMLQERF